MKNTPERPRTEDSITEASTMPQGVDGWIGAIGLYSSTLIALFLVLGTIVQIWRL